MGTSNEGNYGVRWFVCNSRGYRRLKERFFKTPIAREKFVERLWKAESFVKIESYCDPIKIDEEGRK